MDNQQLIDPVDIASAAKALLRIVEGDWPEGQSKQLPILLLKALCKLAVEDANRSREGWEPKEIADAMVMLDAPWGKLDVNDARIRVNDHWKGLIPLWDQRKASVQERLNGDGLRIEPILEKQSSTGGRGKKVRYKLQFFTHTRQCVATDIEAQGAEVTAIESRALRVATDEVDDAADRPLNKAKFALASRSIRYYSVPIELPRALRWIPTEGLGTRGVIDRRITVLILYYFGVILALVIAGLIKLLQAPTVIDFLKIGLSSFFALSFQWLIVRELLSLIKNRVVRAPIWWQTSLLSRDNVIELRYDPISAFQEPKTKANFWSKYFPRALDNKISFIKEPMDESFPRLHLIRYVADCPICGVEGAGRSSIRLAPGGREFYSRIVGRCQHAPNEHVWSFDHIARTGRFLR